MKNPLSPTLIKKLKLASPSGEILVHHKGKKVFSYHWGNKYKYYDLASLTKILFTNHFIIRAYEEKKINLKKKVSDYLPHWHSGVKIENLLRHDSGYSWWKPIYKSIPLDLREDLRFSFLKNLILKEKKEPTGKSLYSDLDYFILGFLLEEIYQMPLIDLAHRLDHPFHFQFGNELKYSKKFYAPTEKCPWRKKRLQGEVHDQNAWALGGVAPHAGLFGSIEQMGEWALEFRKNYQTKASWKLFCKKAKNDWALGFMMPTKGSASCGKYFHPSSIGHTGFTGTSFWYDPVVDMSVVILSNRVYHGANAKAFPQLRGKIHDEIFEGIIC